MTPLASAANRDKPLSFHWNAQDKAWLDRLDLPAVRSQAAAKAQASILLEAVVVGRAEPGRFISYSRRNEFYTDLLRYHGTTYTFANVVPAIDKLADMGLLENHKTKAGRRGRQSVFRATDDLLTIFDQPVPVLYDPREVIRLKDADGNLIDYRDTTRTNRMRKHLREINEALTAAAIELIAPSAIKDGNVIRCGEHTLYLMMKALHRVFSRGSFNKHGRFYGGGSQQAHKEDRKFLTIDGGTTVEVDYPSLHPSMLYAMAGKILEGDAYDVAGWDRDLCKGALCAIINARTPQAALAAVANKICGEGAFAKARELIEALQQKHAAIAEYFGSDVGIDLMRHDSDMVEHTLLSLIRKGIVALPIHDSFIAREPDKGALVEAMAEALERFLRDVNFSTAPISYAEKVPHMPPSLFPLPLLLLPPENPDQLDLFGQPSVSVPFHEVHAWTGGIAPGSIRKAVRHELRRRGVRQGDLASRIGVSRSQLTNILDGRFGAGPEAAKGLKAFILEGAETVNLKAA